MFFKQPVLFKLLCVLETDNQSGGHEQPLLKERQQFVSKYFKDLLHTCMSGIVLADKNV